MAVLLRHIHSYKVFPVFPNGFPNRAGRNLHALSALGHRYQRHHNGFIPQRHAHLPKQARVSGGAASEGVIRARHQHPRAVFIHQHAQKVLRRHRGEFRREVNENHLVDPPRAHGSFLFLRRHQRKRRRRKHTARVLIKREYPGGKAAGARLRHRSINDGQMPRVHAVKRAQRHRTGCKSL